MAFSSCYTSEDINKVLNGIYDEVGGGTVELAERIRDKAFAQIRATYAGDEETARGLAHRFLETSIRHPLFIAWVADTGIHIQRMCAEQSWDLFAYWLSHGATILRPPTDAELLRIADNLNRMRSSQGRCYMSEVCDNPLVRRACDLYEERSGIPLMTIIN
jgi:hypothetical protein